MSRDYKELRVFHAADALVASKKFWVQFLETSLGSACEARYLLELSSRLQFLDKAAVYPLCERYSQLIAGLQALISSMPEGRRSKAEGRRLKAEG